jgi:hypothetical protein
MKITNRLNIPVILSSKNQFGQILISGTNIANFAASHNPYNGPITILRVGNIIKALAVV